MDTAHQQIEQQMTTLLRRVQRIHLSTSDADVDLERSAYGIMCKLADEGPQRLGALAHGVRARPVDDHPPGAGPRGDRDGQPQDGPVGPARLDPRPHRRGTDRARPDPLAPQARASSGADRLAGGGPDRLRAGCCGSSTPPWTGCSTRAERYRCT